MKLSVLLALVAAISSGVRFSDGAQILALFPVGTKSHKIAAMPIIEALAEKGHHIILVSPFKLTKSIDNVEEIYLEGVAAMIKENYFDWFEMQKQNPLIQLSLLVYKAQDTFRNSYLDLMSNARVLQVIRERKVDLVLADGFFNEMVFPIIDHLKVPFVLHCSMPNLGHHYRNLGSHIEYASAPVGLSDSTDEMSFFERMTNMISLEIFIAIKDYYLVGMLEELTKRDFPQKRPIKEIAKDVSLIVVNSHPTTAWTRSLPPIIIPAGSLHTVPTKPLEEPLKKFADDAKDGLIIFSLGSLVKMTSMPENNLQTFVRVFSKFDKQRIFWKWEEEKLPDNLSPNVIMSDWLPQQDLLGHPNARLFITHGGLLGIQETIYHGIPVLGLPFGSDQRSNLAKANKEGYGLKLDWDRLDDQVLYDTIYRLLNEPSFKANAARMSSLVRDEMVPRKDVAVYWIEHVLRHGGTKHLQLASKNMPFYKRYLIDVALFIVAVLFNVFLLLYTIIHYLISKCFRSKKIKTN